MLKVLAVLRTGFLVFMLGYAGVIWFRSMGMVTDCALQLGRCARVNYSLSWAVGLAIAWIGLETLIGWGLAHRESRRSEKAARPDSHVPPATSP
ncbi:MAG TPA: hypothetical protein VEB43_00990 [Anaeromyxobacter sp.]|nr:hypothetical protein [Anaeromyxobacter sp.]